MVLRKFIKYTAVGCFGLVSILLVLSALIPFISPAVFWPISFIGFAFPFLFLAEIFFLIVWIFRKAKLVYIFSIIILLINLKGLFATVGFNFFSSMPEQTASSLKVLSWNVSKWDERNKQMRGGESYRKQMLELIEREDADILCFQEFFECKNPAHFESTVEALQKMGYQYYSFKPTLQLHGNTFQYGLAVFSKWPVVRDAWYPNQIGSHSEGVLYSDIKKGDDTVRVVVSHLESIGFSKEDFAMVKRFRGSRIIARKIRNSYALRGLQADSVARMVQECPYPVISATDLDDIPNSYSYFRMKGDLQDCFLQKGAGLGKTYPHLFQNLRIDYLFAGQEFKVKQYRALNVVFSDHFPIIVTLDFTRFKSK